jgi:cellulose biosynthesis protein BcsQ
MKSLRQMQRELSGRGGFLWVDTPPSTHGFMEDLLRAADLVLVPMTGSPDDVEASLATLELAQQVDRPSLVLFNRIRRPPNTIFRELYEHLAREHRVAKAVIPDKVVVLEGRFRGTGVVEDDPGDMGRIYLGLLDEIEACLKADRDLQGAA